MESTLFRKTGAFMTAIALTLAAFAMIPVVPAHAADCGFTRNLYVGSTGSDVLCLQRYLNGAGFVIATSGVGSPGSETQTFGPGTEAAVKKVASRKRYLSGNGRLGACVAGEVQSGEWWWFNADHADYSFHKRSSHSTCRAPERD